MQEFNTKLQHLKENFHKIKKNKLGNLTKILEDYKYCWDLQARTKQLEPECDWFIWLILTGRGWGKTRTAAEFIKKRVLEKKAKRILIVARTPTEMRDYSILGESGILSVFPENLKPTYYPAKTMIEFHNGAIADLRSAQEPDNVRGGNYDTVWLDEFASYPKINKFWETLIFGVRKGEMKIIITTTPKPTKLLKEIIKMDNTVLTCGNSYENLANLSDKFVETLDRYKNSRIGQQEIYGEIIENVEGALWKVAEISDNRIVELPQLDQICIGVDPATTSSNSSNETGIIVAGKDKMGHGYLISDNSMRGSPSEWAAEVIRLYKFYGANSIIAETNQGGEMVEETLRAAAKKTGLNEFAISIKKVHASRGKLTRAEPIQALYSNNIIHHMGEFPELENQMLSYTGKDNSESPDRLDALVWVLTFLFIKDAKYNIFNLL